MTDAGGMNELFARMRNAENEGQANRLGLASHERECALRYGHINASVAQVNANVEGLRKDQRAAAVAVGTLMLGVLAFLIKQAFWP